MLPEIAIDASRAAGPERTGTEWYSYELIKAMIELEDRPDLLLYHRESNLPFASAARVRHRVIRAPRLWTHLGLSSAILRDRPRSLFVPSHVIPIVHPRSSVVTIHDLGYRQEPSGHSRQSRTMLDLTTRWNAVVARRIIAISGQTRDDLVQHYHVPSSKIQVIHSGVNHERFRPVHPATIKLPEGVIRPYILFLSTVQPRKNVGRLLDAFIALNEPNVQLVIAGKTGWLATDIETRILMESRSHNVHRLGYVASSFLPGLYSAAEIFILPSLFEGFGLGVLEAMASGCPVVASNVSSLPEVAGDAAIFVDPMSVASIRDGLQQALDHTEQHRLRTAGLRHASEFTWERTAQQTMATIQQAIRDNQ